VDALKREQNIVETQSFETSRKAFVDRQLGLRQMEMNRLEDETHRKVQARERETHDAATVGNAGGVQGVDVVDKLLSQRDELQEEGKRMQTNTQASAARLANDRAKAAAAYQYQHLEHSVGAAGGGGAGSNRARGSGRGGSAAATAPPLVSFTDSVGRADDTPADRISAWERSQVSAPDSAAGVLRESLNLLQDGEDSGMALSRLEERRYRERQQTNVMSDVMKLRRRFAASAGDAPSSGTEI
jgi:hypothetical protein